MHSIKEIVKMNNDVSDKLRVSALRRECRGKPYGGSGPSLLTPYKAAAKFWPGIAEQITQVSPRDCKGYKRLAVIECNKFGESGKATIAELREWIRLAPTMAENPYIGMIGNNDSDSFVTIALFDKERR